MIEGLNNPISDDVANYIGIEIIICVKLDILSWLILS